MEGHDRIECTRAEFARQFGMAPSPDSLGICFVSPDGTTILAEYVFTDDWPLTPATSINLQLNRSGRPRRYSGGEMLDIAELERLYKL